jgi:NAD(P)-dependent dehydrogenase (short-subunit alcohol dehydrogenase family)
MDLELREAVVLLTGGSKGIGLACAKAFAAEGARVAIASRDPANLGTAASELLKSGHSVMTLPVDLCDPKAAAQMVSDVESALGPIRILVNCAGAARRTPPEELTAAHWHAAMDAKYFSYIHAMQAVLGPMAERGAGVIINVIGTGGKVASPTHIPGGAANAALMLASTGLANAFAGKGIRINSINPGLVVTDRLVEGFNAQSRMTGESFDALMAAATAKAPMGRLAVPEDLASVVLFMASKQAGYINGALLTVDGAASSVIL